MNKPLLSAVVAASLVLQASATVSESDRQAAKNPNPNVAADFVSVRELEHKKPGERTTGEVLVRNQHPTRSIRVTVSIRWQDGHPEVAERTVTVTVKPGSEAVAFRHYPRTRDDLFVTTIGSMTFQ